MSRILSTSLLLLYVCLPHSLLYHMIFYGVGNKKNEQRVATDNYRLIASRRKSVSIYKIPQNHSDWLSLGHVFNSGKVTMFRNKRYHDWPGQWGRVFLWLTAPSEPHRERTAPQGAGHIVMGREILGR